ncbi:zinc-binding dehydrogenase [Actinomadura opuntiae]|uniref:zinc-binding dehydrogenase n=1 Tax=Actinomadura sp. OS1-43 TaxID=604315 RepID=UPI00255A9EDA|nr:zinc-binding dehydrogenase [Actinomadura sp. OS1-43]MDL4819720.1 zinc-binding dehydrogenase [Actinomadura sp. OS1-43]
MRVAGFDAPGGPDVLRVMEVPAPEAGPGQVRVRVRAAGVQPFDLARAAELGVRTPPDKRSAARVAEAARFHAEGRLRLHVRATFPLDRAADAHRLVATGHGRGKVVLTLG